MIFEKPDQHLHCGFPDLAVTYFPFMINTVYNLD